MKKMRRDIVVRRFLAGWRVVDLVLAMTEPDETPGGAIAYVEGCIRRALNMKRGTR